MRTSVVSIDEPKGEITVIYPEESVFAFNPLYIELNANSNVNFNVQLVVSPLNGLAAEARCITCSLFRGRGKIYFSRILQLFFSDIIHCRSVFVNVDLKHNGTTFFSTIFKVLWGAISVGDRFMSGVFGWEDGRPTLELNRVWFKNFPFTVSMFSPDPLPNIKGQYDNKIVEDVFYPNFNGILQSLSLATNKKVENAIVPTRVYYIISEKVFYAINADNEASTKWGKTDGIRACDMYNIGEEARNDAFWVNLNEPNILYRYDSQEEMLRAVDYGNPQPYGIFELRPSISLNGAKKIAIYNMRRDCDLSTFDFTFDYTFYLSHKYDVRVKLIICENKCGHYLRWVDRFGNFQYFLFAEGTEEIKNEVATESIVEDFDVRGVTFMERQRFISVSATKTYKCCAVSLPKDIYDYVSSILYSPIIDIYLGTSEGGLEIWIPVNIVSSKLKQKSRDVLHDIEISFTMPERKSQTL